MTEDPDILIIGAGAAGIAAARQLSAGGFTTLILEALPRLGGRAWTHHAAGASIDLGCGWLHSARRNPWTVVAEQSSVAVHRGQSAWSVQFRDLGFSPEQQEAAHEAYADWSERLEEAPPASDIAAEALDPNSPWNAYIQTISGFISGDELERISVTDYLAYDEASSDDNWRLPAGYGALIAGSVPGSATVKLSTPVEAVSLDGQRVAIHTASGTIRARAVIVTMSSNVLASGAIAWPSALDPWREAAARLPLGWNEKLFFEIVGDSPFETETHVIGNPLTVATGSYYIKPFGYPVLECFLGGASARAAASEGHVAAFTRATDELANLFGASVRQNLKPLVASEWTNTPSIGGSYSHALPGQADARTALAKPFDNRLFFAGEATHVANFSTAHGAYETGIRAANEAMAALKSPSS